MSSFAPPRALGAAGVPPSQAMAARSPPSPPLRGARPTPAPRMLLACGSGTGGAPLVAPLLASFSAPFSAPSGTAAPGADPRGSSSAHLLGTRAGNSFGKLPFELFGHNSRGTQSSEQPGHKTRKEATASLRAADTTAASADAASCPPNGNVVSAWSPMTPPPRLGNVAPFSPPQKNCRTLCPSLWRKC